MVRKTREDARAKSGRPAPSRARGASRRHGALGAEAVDSVQAGRTRAEAVLATLFRIEETAGARGDLPDLYAAIRSVLRDLLGAKTFHVVLRDETSGGLTFPYFAGEANAGPRERLEWTEQVLRTGEPLVADGASPRSWLGVPLKAGEKTVGALVVEGRPDGAGYGEGEKEILGFVVRRVEAALERQRAEQESKRVVSVLQSTLDSTADGILVVDHGGRVLSFNQRFAQLWRIPQPMLEMRDDVALLAHVLDQLKQPEQFLSKVRELYSQPEAEAFDELEFKDGRTLERYSIPLRQDGEAVGRVWSFHDVTRSRDLERRLRQAHKVEALSRLAGGVAHDFNDLLTVITSRGELARKGLSPEAPIRRHLEEIIGAAERATALAHQLLAFSQVEAEPPVEARSPAAAPSEAPRGTETVLLVEDQEAVRVVVREILEAQGYTVLEAGGASEALRAGERHPGPIHLTIADVVIPEMTGPELVRELQPARPRMKVLFISGYADAAVAGEGLLDAEAAFLSKPFSPDTLARKVREILG
jgi:CheY-like chemotaxis protein